MFQFRMVWDRWTVREVPLLKCFNHVRRKRKYAPELVDRLEVVDQVVLQKLISRFDFEEVNFNPFRGVDDDQPGAEALTPSVFR